MTGMNLVILCFATLVVAQLTNAEWAFGRCPAKAGVAITSADLQSTTWYEYSRSNNLLEKTTICSRLTTGAFSNNQGSITLRSYSVLTNSYKTTTGTATILSNTNQLDILYNAPIFGAKLQRYTVLKKDVAKANEKYIILWTCTDFLIGYIEQIWVLTDSATPATTVITNINTALIEAGISSSRLVPVSQSCA